jgi:hypothetical protein
MGGLSGESNAEAQEHADRVASLWNEMLDDDLCWCKEV